MSNPQLSKDWGHPRSSRSFLGYSGGAQSPSGTIVDCVANTKIPCNAEELLSFGKGHVSVTVVGILKLGFSYAPWKKPKKGAAREPRDPNSKNLFEDPAFADAQGQRVMKSARMYSFSKVEGKNADKGPRDDDVCSVIHVGQTFHFQIHDFMFENKAYGENVFPSDVPYFPAFSVVRIMLNAGHVVTAGGGYGMSIGTVRPVEFSLYSYLYPLGLDLLPQSYDEAIKATEALVDDCKSIRNMLERTNVAFCARIHKGSFLSQGSPGWFKLVSEDGCVCDGVDALDISEADLLHFTNAGEDLAYATFLVDLAAAAGALRVYVTHSEWYCKQDSTLCCFRAAPLVDTEALLTDKFLGNYFTDAPAEGSEEVQVTLQTEVPQLNAPFMLIQPAPDRLDGPDPTCPDLALSSTSIQTMRGYRITIGDRDEEDIARIVFRASESGKRAGGYQRIAYRAIAQRKPE